jgi:multidrug efflux pump subunit AcrA (membrane-fusion protein)
MRGCDERFGENCFENAIRDAWSIFAALLTFAASGCGRTQVQAASAMPAPLVTLANATAQDVPRYLDEIGRNGAFELVTVTPQVGGRITERHFQDGENLKKGQILFVIDPRPYRAQFAPAAAHPGRPMRRTRSWKRESERRGSKPGRSRTPGLNRSS